LKLFYGEKTNLLGRNSWKGSNIFTHLWLKLLHKIKGNCSLNSLKKAMWANLDYNGEQQK
jgi:hypothetical protein